MTQGLLSEKTNISLHIYRRQREMISLCIKIFQVFQKYQSILKLLTKWSKATESLFHKSSDYLRLKVVF